MPAISNECAGQFGWPLKKHGDRPLLGADDRRVLNYETVILRRPARNVMRLARLIAMVSMSRSTFLSEAKKARGIKVQNYGGPVKTYNVTCNYTIDPFDSLGGIHSILTAEPTLYVPRS